MPKIFLSNGDVINISSIPNKHEYHYFPIDKWDELISKIVNGLEIKNNKISESTEIISDILTEMGSDFYMSEDSKGILLSKNGDSDYEYFEEKKDISKNKKWN